MLKQAGRRFAIIVDEAHFRAKRFSICGQRFVRGWLVPSYDGGGRSASERFVRAQGRNYLLAK